MDLRREIVLSIKGNSYKAKFPTVGQLIDIETAKASLSKGKYGELMSAGTINSFAALDRIDMIAYISVLVPDVVKDLKVDRFEDLDIFDANELMKEYRAQLVPWIKEWQALLSEFEPTPETPASEDADNGVTDIPDEKGK